MSTYKSNEKVVEVLLRNGADIEIKNKFGNSALILASHEGNEQIVELLLRFGAKNVMGAFGVNSLIEVLWPGA